MTYYLDCGGVERALINLLKSLDPQKYEIDLLLVRKTGAEIGRVPEYVNVISLEPTDDQLDIMESYPVPASKRLIASGRVFAAASLLLKYAATCIKNGKNCYSPYEIVYGKYKLDKEYDAAFDFHGYNSFPTYFISKRVSAKYKATWLHCTSFIHERLVSMKKYLYAYDRVYGVSLECCNKFSKYIPDMADRVRLFYNINDVEAIQKKAKDDVCMPNDTVNLVTVGRISTQKGYDIAVNAAHELKKRNINFKWYFVGDGAERNKIESLIEEKNVSDRIVMVGYTDNPYKYIGKCDIYVQPSKWEGYCLTLLEARVLKKTIICSDLPVLQEQIKDGINGAVFKSEDCNDLCDKIEAVIKGGASFEEGATPEELSYKSEVLKLYDFVNGVDK